MHIRQSNGWQYNLIIASAVVALIVGDFSIENFKCDVIVEHNKRGLQRISELHPSFMALSYLLLFPYSEGGYRVRILHRTNVNRSHYKWHNLSIRMYYAYHL